MTNSFQEAQGMAYSRQLGKKLGWNDDRTLDEKLWPKTKEDLMSNILENAGDDPLSQIYAACLCMSMEMADNKKRLESRKKENAKPDDTNSDNAKPDDANSDNAKLDNTNSDKPLFNLNTDEDMQATQEQTDNPNPDTEEITLSTLPEMSEMEGTSNPMNKISAMQDDVSQVADSLTDNTPDLDMDIEEERKNSLRM